jgi:transcription elongation factor GreA
MNDQIISQEGYDKLKSELDILINIKRREIADRIQKAKDMGDLSENAEYAEAKDAQAFNEGRIAELSQTLKNVTVVENGNGEGKVSMGTTLVVKSNGTEKTYKIVSFNEADPMEGKISNESPLGHSFVGKKRGDKVVVETPKGKMEYEILSIA